MRKRSPGRSPTGRLIRIDQGQRRLTRRDPDILRLIGEQYTYRFDQLQGQLARHPDTHAEDPRKLSETRTREAIHKWEQLGLAQSRKIYEHEPAYVWLTRHGLRFVDLDLAPWSPTDRLNHTYWITEVRARLAAMVAEGPDLLPYYTWESERCWKATRNRLLKAQKATPSLEVPRSYLCPHIPDAVVHYTHGGVQCHVAIEVQLSMKPQGWFERIWNALMWHHTAVWYYVGDEVKKETFLEMLHEWQQKTPGYHEPTTQMRRAISVDGVEKFL